MKKPLVLIASAAFVAGAYIWSFGVPASVSPFIGAETETPAASNTRPAGRRGGGATSVVLTPLTLMPYEDTLHAVGSAKALQSATVTSDVSGKITALNLTPNTQVSQGDSLVQLDDRVERLNLEKAEGELVQARDAVSRYERLRATGNATVSDVVISDARLAQQLAEVNVGLAQLALDDRTVLAPISGTLGLSDLNVGDTLGAGMAIVTIDNADALIVDFELPERSIALLAKGREVLLGTPSLTGRVFNGHITSFDSRIDPTTRSVSVEARVENADGDLWPGMTFSVRLIDQTAPMAALPSTAVTWSRDGARIWVAQDGTAVQQPITIVHRRNDLVWLDVDVPAGTMVVTEGAQKMRAGAKIMDVDDHAAEEQVPQAERVNAPARPSGTPSSEQPT